MNETETDDADAGDGPLCTGVVTISSSRSLENDEAGTAILTTLKNDGNEITVREHVGAEYDKVQSIVSRLIDRDDVDLILTAGATGVEPDDVTIEAVSPLLEKELTAFNDLFTVLAHELIGTQVVTARTLAGVADGTPVFCLPGWADVARLALEEIILSEAPAIIELAREEPEADEAANGEPTDGDGADGGA